MIRGIIGAVGTGKLKRRLCVALYRLGERVRGSDAAVAENRTVIAGEESVPGFDRAPEIQLICAICAGQTEDLEGPFSHRATPWSRFSDAASLPWLPPRSCVPRPIRWGTTRTR